MQIQQLESFLQVAENLSFARASEELNITQSAVSRQIHALEEELNAKLFYRTTRTVALTPEGVMFLEHAKQILGHLKVARAKLRHHTNVRVQTLTIGCEGRSDLDRLCGILRACRGRIETFHPLIRLDPRRSLLNLFYQGEVEVMFGFRENLPAGGELVYRELGKAPLCCVLPRDHPLAGRELVEERELYAQPLIVCDGYAVHAKAVEAQHRVARHLSPELVQMGESAQVILTLVRAGYGCSILPRAAREDPELAYVPLRGAPPLSYGVVCDKNAANPALGQFLDLALGDGRRR